MKKSQGLDLKLVQIDNAPPANAQPVPAPNSQPNPTALVTPAPA